MQSPGLSCFSCASRSAAAPSGDRIRPNSAFARIDMRMQRGNESNISCAVGSAMRASIDADVGWTDAELDAVAVVASARMNRDETHDDEQQNDNDDPETSSTHCPLPP